MLISTAGNLAGTLEASSYTAEDFVQLDVIDGGITPALPLDDVSLAVAPPIALGHTAGALRGQIDILRRNRVEGWAHDDAAAGEPVQLAVTIDGVEFTRLLANMFREDLQAAGIGAGRHAFSVRIPWLSPAEPHVITVRRVADGKDIARSPGTIDTAVFFDVTMEDGLRRIIAALADGDEQNETIVFLQAQTDLLMQRRAKTSGGLSGKRTALWPDRPAGFIPATAPAAPAALQALVIGAALPQPGEPGSAAILGHMRSLQTLGYAVTFVVGHNRKAPDAAELALEAMGIACCQPPFYVTLDEALGRMADAIDLVYFHRLPELSPYVALARAYLPKARLYYRERDGAGGAPAAERGAAIRWTEIDAAWAGETPIAPCTVAAALLRQAALPGAGMPAMQADPLLRQLALRTPPSRAAVSVWWGPASG